MPTRVRPRPSCARLLAIDPKPGGFAYREHALTERFVLLRHRSDPDRPLVVRKIAELMHCVPKCCIPEMVHQSLAIRRI